MRTLGVGLSTLLTVACSEAEPPAHTLECPKLSNWGDLNDPTPDLAALVSVAVRSEGYVVNRQAPASAAELQAFLRANASAEQRPLIVLVSGPDISCSTYSAAAKVVDTSFGCDEDHCIWGYAAGEDARPADVPGPVTPND